MYIGAAWGNLPNSLAKLKADIFVKEIPQAPMCATNHKKRLAGGMPPQVHGMVHSCQSRRPSQAVGTAQRFRYGSMGSCYKYDQEKGKPYLAVLVPAPAEDLAFICKMHCKF